MKITYETTTPGKIVQVDIEYHKGYRLGNRGYTAYVTLFSVRPNGIMTCILTDIEHHDLVLGITRKSAKYESLALDTWDKIKFQTLTAYCAKHGVELSAAAFLPDRARGAA